MRDGCRLRRAVRSGKGWAICVKTESSLCISRDCAAISLSEAPKLKIVNAQVPLCCKYCMDVYADSCQSTQPVNSGFMSVGHLYDTFYSGDVRSMCKNSASSSGISQCVGAFDAMQREPGNPCLGVRDTKTLKNTQTSTPACVSRFGCERGLDSSPIPAHPPVMTSRPFPRPGSCSRRNDGFSTAVIRRFPL